ncbi:hypothetical protein J2X53_002174 [Pseudorhodobacter sp. 4114]|nr:hypothetical protein [Pseudorhodobacter sp. 4114]
MADQTRLIFCENQVNHQFSAKIAKVNFRRKFVGVMSHG